MQDPDSPRHGPLQWIDTDAGHLMLLPERLLPQVVRD